MFYVVNNSGLYVFRHTNGSFPSKWAGIWALDKKYVDYWAYKVNGVWLSPDLCAWSNGHNYKVGDITVRETVHVRQGKVISSLTFEGNGDVSLDLEVGVNMRYRDEDLHGRKYSFDKGKIVSDLGKLTVKLMGSSFKPLGLYSTHNPGSNIPFALWYEQEQSKFVPGIWHTEFKLKGKKKLNTYFIVDFKNKNVEEPFGEFRNRELSSLMKIAFSGLKTFAANNHLKGVIAGYPYFNEIWVRDTLIVLPAYLYAGMFDYVREILVFVSNYTKDRVPTVINSKGAKYYSDDVNPLWIIGLDYYIRHTRDLSILNDVKDSLLSVVKYGINSIKDGVVHNSDYGTWMDSIPRPNAVEVQSLWIEAFKLAARMLRMLDIDIDLPNLNINPFIKKGIIVDRLDGGLTANILVPLFFKQVSHKVASRVIDLVEQELVTPSGVRTMGKSDRLFKGGYHTGAVWPLLNNLAAAAYINYDRDGVKFLTLNRSLVGKYCINSIHETEGGAVAQAWSVLPVIHIVDEFILGIKPDLVNKRLYILPNYVLNTSFKRKLLIGEDVVNITYTVRKGLDIEVDGFSHKVVA